MLDSQGLWRFDTQNILKNNDKKFYFTPHPIWWTTPGKLNAEKSDFHLKKYDLIKVAAKNCKPIYI